MEESPPGEEIAPLARLIEVARGLAGILDLDRLLPAILDGVIAQARARRGAILLRDSSGELAVRAVRDGQGQDLDPTSFELTRSVVDEAVTTGKAVVLDDASMIEGYRQRESIVSLNLRTVLCAPLVGSVGTIGLLYVDSHLTAHRFTHEDRSLIEAFAAVATVALESVRLHEASRERDRMAVELDLAARIQRSFLPLDFPRTPGFNAEARAVPAGQVGGDFYDFQELPGGCTAVVVADVSGKGVPAAISMARLVSQIRGGLARSPDVADLLRTLNRSMLRRGDGERFVTLVAAVLDPLSEEVAIWRCGHPPPLLVEADGVRELETRATPPLGVTEEVDPRMQRFVLRPGSRLLLYTDGVTDARDLAGGRFGRTRLLEAARRAGPSAADLVDGVRTAVDAHARAGRRDDDLTLVALERTRE